MRLTLTKDYTQFSQMVGANLRFCRVAKKLTQTKVANVLNFSFQQVQKYESGSNCPNAYRLVQFANLFKVSVQELLNPDFIANNCNAKLFSPIKANVSFDVTKYEEFEDEYPAPLTNLEYDWKMRATYDGIIDGRKKKRH